MYVVLLVIRIRTRMNSDFNETFKKWYGMFKELNEYATHIPIFDRRHENMRCQIKQIRCDLLETKQAILTFQRLVHVKFIFKHPY